MHHVLTRSITAYVRIADMWSTPVEIRVEVRGPSINPRDRDVHANVNNPNGKKNSEYQGNGFGSPYARWGQRRTTTNQPALTLTLYPYRNVFHGRIATKAERRVKAIKVVCGCSCCNLGERVQKRASAELVFLLIWKYREYVYFLPICFAVYRWSLL